MLLGPVPIWQHVAG